MMEPPAIKPLESETPEDNRVSRKALSFVSFSINNLSKAPHEDNGCRGDWQVET